MEPKESIIWVQGLDEESVMALTDFGASTASSS
jgi:hypothetical protein